MTGRRVRLGRELVVIRETPDGVDVEGVIRLRPGQVVELVAADGGPGVGRGGRARVQSWSVAHVGSSGPIYGGHCAWQDSGG